MKGPNDNISIREAANGYIIDSWIDGEQLTLIAVDLEELVPLLLDLLDPDDDACAEESAGD